MDKAQIDEIRVETARRICEYLDKSVHLVILTVHEKEIFELAETDPALLFSLYMGDFSLSPIQYLLEKIALGHTIMDTEREGKASELIHTILDVMEY